MIVFQQILRYFFVCPFQNFEIDLNVTTFYVHLRLMSFAWEPKKKMCVLNFVETSDDRHEKSLCLKFPQNSVICDHLRLQSVEISAKVSTLSSLFCRNLPQRYSCKHSYMICTTFVELLSDDISTNLLNSRG